MSSLSVLTILPVPSICPDTICPPNRPLQSIALSRSTLLPEPSSPRLLLVRVSFITSAVNVSFVNPVTVRHTPFTATLSPSLRSSNIFDPDTVSLEDFAPLSTLTTEPISSTIPVNKSSHLPFDKYVLIKA